MDGARVAGLPAHERYPWPRMAQCEALVHPVYGGSSGKHGKGNTDTRGGLQFGSPENAADMYELRSPGRVMVSFAAGIALSYIPMSFPASLVDHRPLASCLGIARELEPAEFLHQLGDMSAAADDHNEGAAGGHLASLSRVAVVREPIHRFVAGVREIILRYFGRKHAYCEPHRGHGMASSYCEGAAVLLHSELHTDRTSNLTTHRFKSEPTFDARLRNKQRPARLREQLQEAKRYTLWGRTDFVKRAQNLLATDPREGATAYKAASSAGSLKQLVVDLMDAFALDLACNRKYQFSDLLATQSSFFTAGDALRRVLRVEELSELTHNPLNTRASRTASAWAEAHAGGNGSDDYDGGAEAQQLQQCLAEHMPRSTGGDGWKLQNGVRASLIPSEAVLLQLLQEHSPNTVRLLCAIFAQDYACFGCAHTPQQHSQASAARCKLLSVAAFAHRLTIPLDSAAAGLERLATRSRTSAQAWAASPRRASRSSAREQDLYATEGS